MRDLDLPVRIEVCPTVRDAGRARAQLAQRLSVAGGPQRAPALKRALDAARAGDQRPARDAPRTSRRPRARSSTRPAIEPEYLEVLSRDDLVRRSWRPGEQVVIAIAAQVGRARLIDNTLIGFQSRNPEPAVAG